MCVVGASQACFAPGLVDFLHSLHWRNGAHRAGLIGRIGPVLVAEVGAAFHAHGDVLVRSALVGRGALVASMLVDANINLVLLHQSLAKVTVGENQHRSSRLALNQHTGQGFHIHVDSLHQYIVHIVEIVWSEFWVELKK